MVLLVCYVVGGDGDDGRWRCCGDVVLRLSGIHHQVSASCGNICFEMKLLMVQLERLAHEGFANESLANRVDQKSYRLSSAFSAAAGLGRARRGLLSATRSET